ncbi:hypothetical protein FA13DRAFT_1713703 [Coprinellus micaceus]|uniref:Uncharacterized protein n=1 Tax=Coprinellus micaceus TaxID=71717 RepID=A0A4Y7SVF7_COPMI|nr:hypothetical protein FA13DRAFT_1713703 [Coprinellus micaceus]
MASPKRQVTRLCAGKGRAITKRKREEDKRNIRAKLRTVPGGKDWSSGSARSATFAMEVLFKASPHQPLPPPCLIPTGNMRGQGSSGEAGNGSDCATGHSRWANEANVEGRGEGVLERYPLGWAKLLRSQYRPALATGRVPPMLRRRGQKGWATVFQLGCVEVIIMPEDIQASLRVIAFVRDTQGLDNLGTPSNLRRVGSSGGPRLGARTPRFSPSFYPKCPLDSTNSEPQLPRDTWACMGQNTFTLPALSTPSAGPGIVLLEAYTWDGRGEQASGGAMAIQDAGVGRRREATASYAVHVRWELMVGGRLYGGKGSRKDVVVEGASWKIGLLSCLQTDSSCVGDSGMLETAAEVYASGPTRIRSLLMSDSGEVDVAGNNAIGPSNPTIKELASALEANPR